VLYALIMVGVLLFLVRDNVIGALAGVLVSGPLYLALGTVLAKFGYRRKTMAELRADRESSKQAAREEEQQKESRGRPPPTSRTSGGSNRPKSKRRR
jgi:uncharacterized membrane protein YGL010W